MTHIAFLGTGLLGSAFVAALPRIAERMDVLVARGHGEEDLAAIGKDSVRRQATESR